MTKKALKKVLVPTQHSKLYKIYYYPNQKVLWLEVLAEVDIDLCIYWMRDGLDFLNQTKEPVDVFFNLTYVKKFNANCIQSYQVPEFPPFINHLNMKRQLYIGAPPYIQIVASMIRMFIENDCVFFDTEKEALEYLKEM